MAEQGRSQLHMMLLQQAGPGSLGLSNLSPDAFVEFLRKIEQIVLNEKLSPVIVYWSSHDVQPLLPAGQRYRQLMRDAFCISAFAEGRPDPPHEWGYFMESPGLCMVVCGQKSGDLAGGGTYQCAGSLDPQIVRQAFNKMLPFWQFIDHGESNRLEDARSNLGPIGSQPHLVQRCRSEWPVVKLKMSEGKVLSPPQGGPSPLAASVGSGQSGSAWSPWEVYGDASEWANRQEAVGAPGSGAAAAAARDPGQQAAVVAPDPGAAAAAVAAVTSRLGELARPGLPRRRGAEAEGAAPVVETVEAPAARPAIPPAAQEIIRDIIGQLRHSSDLSQILQLAIERLTLVGKAHRGLIWQIVGDQLEVTNEYSTSGHTPFVETRLGSQESTAIVLEFLSRFPDESGVGVISIPDTLKDTQLHKLSSTLATLIELGDARARLVAQLRCQGVFSGFLELQQCGQTREWAEEEAAVLQHVANMLSVVVKQARDKYKIESDAERLELINQIASSFRESKGQRSQDTLVQSLKLMKEHMGFVHAQIYLHSQEEELLLPQYPDAQAGPLSIADKDNPFVSVFESGRLKIINLEPTGRGKGDPYFGHHTAMVIPLMSESERLGVVGLWERLPGKPPLRQQDKDLAETISGQLASNVRADQAIAQIRSEQAREALINRVTSEMKESPGEVEQLLATPVKTLVSSLQEYFGLALCAMSLYDLKTQEFPRSVNAGPLAPPEDAAAPHFGVRLCVIMREQLKRGQTIFLAGDEIKHVLQLNNVSPPADVKTVALVPLVHGGKLKGALCMASTDRQRPLPDKDMRMVTDLADRVAGALSHAELFAQVQREAVTDALTGLYNRRYFSEQMSKEIDRYQRFGHAFSYIIVDLDFLKKINDTLGHEYGDAAIKHIAQVLKRTTRDVDTVARYGGEEFVILLPVTDVSSARIAAERVCTAIRDNPVEGFCDRKEELEEKIRIGMEQEKINEADAARFRVGQVTASVGVSTFPSDAQEREKLTELADEALYLAKRRGRNQVCSVSEDLMPSLKQGGDEALDIQMHTIQKRAEEMPIDIKLIAEHGILGIMGALVKFIEARDAYTRERSPKAAEYAGKLAQLLHLSKEHINIISLAAVLNNLGKIALPEKILKKKGPLTPEERKMIEQSPAIGAKILEPAKQLQRVASVVEAYHEHWDGTGYPKGLKGEEIPLESRIIALVDAYIAMTSDRPYRKALSHEEAVKQLQEGAGKDWDPRLVKMFLTMLQKERPAS